MRFSNSVFFHHSNRPGLLTNGLKQFGFLFRFRRDIRIFLKFRAVAYCAESSFAQDDTSQSQVSCSIILLGIKFRAV